MLKIKSFLSKTATLIILLATASNLTADTYAAKAKNAGKCILKTGWSAAKGATIVYCLKQAHYFHTTPQLKQLFSKTPLAPINQLYKSVIFLHSALAATATKSLYDDVKAFTKYRADQKEATQKTAQ